MPKSAKPDVRTRRAIIDVLKQEGPREAAQLSLKLGVTAMAVRQHLYELTEEKLVTYQDEARPIGRPARVWRLTPAADRLFPDAHAMLTVRLLDAMRQTFGPKGIDQLLTARTKQQFDEYRKRIPAGSLQARVNALAKIRSEEGYMAEVFPQPDGTLLLVENHCPICSAATECQALCVNELSLFQRLLGNGVAIERTEHILSGARRCAYRIHSKA
jgi:predicted ArsR family transcriptional regulator